MADERGKYWDCNEARWVRYAGPDAPVEIPAQLPPVASEREADVLSG
jgi:hypothetical protein